MRVEIRSDSVLVSGYVNAVERDSRILQSPKGEFVEQVRSGVWKNAIDKNSDIPVLLNHNWNKKLGSTKNNLKLREDNIGLYAEARFTDPDIIKKAKDKELVGWSFGFKTNKQSWGKTDNNVERRYLEDIYLTEVSILDKTRTPAYYGTSVESRDNEEMFIERRAFESDINIISLEESNPDPEVKVKDEERNIENEKLKIKAMELELEL